MISQPQAFPRTESNTDLASLNNNRAAQRKQRLLEIEKEQRIEEAEALRMTEEQVQLLSSSFKSVKVEFADLDGLKWTRTALWKRHMQAQRNALRLRRLWPHFPSGPHPFAPSAALDTTTSVVSPSTNTIVEQMMSPQPNPMVHNPALIRPAIHQEQQQQLRQAVSAARAGPHVDPFDDRGRDQSIPGTRASVRALFSDAPTAPPTSPSPGLTSETLQPVSQVNDQTIRGPSHIDTYEPIPTSTETASSRSSTDTIRPIRGMKFSLGDDTDLDDPYTLATGPTSEPPTPTPFRENPALPDVS